MYSCGPSVEERVSPRPSQRCLAPTRNLPVFPTGKARRTSWLTQLLSSGVSAGAALPSYSNPIPARIGQRACTSSSHSERSFVRSGRSGSLYVSDGPLRSVSSAAQNSGTLHATPVLPASFESFSASSLLAPRLPYSENGPSTGERQFPSVFHARLR